MFIGKFRTRCLNFSNQNIDEIINKNKHYEHEFQVALRSEQG